jgi:predicted dehydrogenase
VPSDIHFTIISNPSALHEDTLFKCINLKKSIFLEKPPIHNLKNVVKLSREIEKSRIKVFCGFNLKFYPIIEWLKNNINPTNVLEVNCYCGSYLPNWRSNSDYRKNYSSIKNLGGGVHLDLIHELDFILWIFGDPIGSYGIAKKISNLEIDTYDSVVYLLEYPSTIINITLNYFRIVQRRTVEFVMNEGIYTVDLLNGKIENEKNEIIFHDNTSINDTYLKQMKYFLEVLDNENELYINSFNDSISTLKICLNLKESLNAR